MEDRIVKLNELIKDEAFLKELFSKEEPEDVQALFEDNGVELTLDEVRQLGDLLGKAANGEITAEQLEKMANGELSEEDLEQVAGGEVFIGAAMVIAIIGGTLAGSTAVGFGVSQLVENWNSVKNWFRRW